MKHLLAPLAALALLISGCAGTPKITDRRLVSVTWVNTTPVPMRNIQTRLNRTYAHFRLEELPPYREVGVEANILLPENSRVATVFTVGDTQVKLPSGSAADPVRTSSTGEYNLRIDMTRRETADLRLEPAQVARARLDSAAGRP